MPIAARQLVLNALKASTKFWPPAGSWFSGDHQASGIPFGHRKPAEQFRPMPHPHGDLERPASNSSRKRSEDKESRPEQPKENRQRVPSSPESKRRSEEETRSPVTPLCWRKTVCGWMPSAWITCSIWWRINHRQIHVAAGFNEFARHAIPKKRCAAAFVMPWLSSHGC